MNHKIPVVGLAALCLLTFSCEAVVAGIPTALRFASNLLSANEQNYGAESIDKLSNVLGLYFDPQRSTQPKQVSMAAPPLALDVAVLRDDTPRSRGILGGTARFKLVPLDAGAELRDGVGRDTPGDRLRVSFTPKQECWVYVLEVDATGYAVPVFPNPDVSIVTNPVPAGKTVLIPDGDQPFELDGYRGTEHFFFLASRVPKPELEQQFTELRGRAARPDPDSSKVTTVSESTVRTRGIKGGSAAKRVHREVVTPSGAKTTVTSQQWLGKIGANEIVVTVPFEHR
jgi:hypothetical protein